MLYINIFLSMIMLYINLLRFRNSKKNSVNKYRMYIIFSTCIIFKKIFCIIFLSSLNWEKLLKIMWINNDNIKLKSQVYLINL